MKVKSEEIENSCPQREGKSGDNQRRYEVEENYGLLFCFQAIETLVGIKVDVKPSTVWKTEAIRNQDAHN